tara:strand:- start:118 stop:510 length:393 start_codon:yes stop_codon:yes gene_type:complete
MRFTIAILFFLVIAAGRVNAGDIPCSLKNFSTELNEEISSGLSVESVRNLLTDRYGIKGSEITQHTYETAATLNTRIGEVVGVKSRLNVILKRCHPMSAFFFETWFSGHYYFNDQGLLINDEYFYTVNAL